MNVKMLVAAIISCLLLTSFATAATSAKLVDDMMASGAMSGTANGMNDNMGAMSGTNAMGDTAMNDSTNTMNNNGMSGSSSMNNGEGSPDTATGDNDY